ncbi:MAG TPA: hypothetical protein PKE64_03750 [Anaerolineae bacterium]|nr:hypothetical protein [Anaerolineae bacterium]HMR63105.1 hypothetical protein [Anaerolineae bacterium]
MALLLTGGERRPHTDKVIQLHNKMLELAEDLLIEEMMLDTLLACGHDFTSKFAGKYGMYELLNGEIIAFQPKLNLNFILICDEFVATSDLTTIRMITRHLPDYELSVAV